MIAKALANIQFTRAITERKNKNYDQKASKTIIPVASYFG
jgi:hypothetical protein